jgi:sugar/nucleoside kinase (ribokinase family)
LHPHDIVDSTGAGDAFIGGFISGWLSDFSDADCMTLGSAVAAAKLGKKGARQGLPTAMEINQRIRAVTTISNNR